MPDNEKDVAEEVLFGPVENSTRNIVDNNNEENAKAADSVGLEAKIVRTTDGNCCSWCDEMAGTYEYSPNMDRSVFGRHDNCRCTVEYVCEKGRQDVWSKKRTVQNSEARTSRIDTITAAEKAREKEEKRKISFAKLADRLKKNYDIDIDEAVKKLDFETVDRAISGVESVIKEYPELANNIAKVTTTNDGIMSCNGADISFNPAYFKEEKIDTLKEIIKNYTESGYFPKNTSLESFGAHETGHAVEWLIIENRPYDYDFQRNLDWNSCQTAKEIVSQACRNVKKTEYGKGKRNIDLIAAISGYAKKTRSETVAESFADVCANGKNANPLSIEIKRQAMEMYNKLKGAK